MKPQTDNKNSAAVKKENPAAKGENCEIKLHIITKEEHEQFRIPSYGYILP